VTLGSSLPRRDAPAKVTGEARYPGDYFPDGVLHALIVFTDQPHARITALDTAAAEAVPGVVLVLTAADVPVNEYGLTMFDQPVLIGPRSTGASSVPCDVSRWEADHLAVVVAETPESARRAAALIQADWEPLPVLADLDAALAPDAPLLHPENGSDSNAYHHYRVRKGDPAAGWEAAEVIVEGTYDLPYQEHAYLQPEAGLSYLDDEGRITVVVAGQWTVEDQEQIAHALALPREQVRVVYPAIGGAFGGREDMSVQIVLALATKVLAERGIRRPVRTQWSREESVVGHHKRHRGRVHTLGAPPETAASPWSRPTPGSTPAAYNYTSNKVLGNLHLCVAGPYEVPNARIDSSAVYTNRCPVAPSGVSEPPGLLRRRDPDEQAGRGPRPTRSSSDGGTCSREGSSASPAPRCRPGVSLPEVVEACADAADWSGPWPSRSPSPRSPRCRRHRRCGPARPGLRVRLQERRLLVRVPRAGEATIVLHGDDGRTHWRRAVPGGRRGRPGRAHRVRADGRRGDRPRLRVIRPGPTPPPRATRVRRRRRG
jgi:hypothetical protein